MDLTDKVVVITGGTKGLGKAIAIAMQAKGAHVAVCSRSADEIEAVKDSGLFVVSADVTKEEDMVRLRDAVVQKFGRLDLWINNAGIWIAHAPLETMDMARVHDMIEVNLFGTMYGSKAALAQMKQQGSGVIINILSTSALEGRANSSGYCASKYAATGFTKSLRKEVAGIGINVFSVYPGGMRTDLFNEGRPEDYASYMDPSEVAEKIIANLETDSPEEELIVRRPK